MKKVQFFTIASLLLVPVLPVHSQEKIRVGQGSVSLQSGLMYIAKDRELFAKYGLAPEIIYIPGGSTNVQVLVSGSLDLSQLSAAPRAAAHLQRADTASMLGLPDAFNS